MLKASDLFHLSYYQKAHFTGSLCGMRYYIEKIEENGTTMLRVWIFPGPFCFDHTDCAHKESKLFAFEESSLPQIADWLNEQYETRADFWNRHRSLFGS